MEPTEGSPETFLGVLRATAEWAAGLHAERGQLWAGLPYGAHLEAVEEVLWSGSVSGT
jgi:hypothetical protein